MFGPVTCRKDQRGSKVTYDGSAKYIIADLFQAGTWYFQFKAVHSRY
jgi:hypothetical protein